eukprot:1202631-Pyramimonas_sp.AAC.1
MTGAKVWRIRAHPLFHFGESFSLRTVGGGEGGGAACCSYIRDEEEDYHNNVQFYTMAYVDAATYQILGNLKIVNIMLYRASKRTMRRLRPSHQGS